MFTLIKAATDNVNIVSKTHSCRTGPKIPFQPLTLNGEMKHENIYWPPKPFADPRKNSKSAYMEASQNIITKLSTQIRNLRRKPYFNYRIWHYMSSHTWSYIRSRHWLTDTSQPYQSTEYKELTSEFLNQFTQTQLQILSNWNVGKHRKFPRHYNANYPRRTVSSVFTILILLDNMKNKYRIRIFVN